jgi:methionine-rich copper-binding protein CopC
VAALAFALSPVAAAAHPHLVGATPPSGTSAPAPPDRIVLSFGEVIDPARSSVTLVGPDGHATPWPSTVSGGTLAVQPPALPAGAWLLRWAVTGADGDREIGDYRFTVAPSPAAGLAVSGGAGSRPGTLERAGRLLLLVLAVPLAGLLLLGGAVLPLDPRRRAVAGHRLATLRSTLWAVELLSLCGFIAGLAAAGGSGLLLVSPAGPPLLVAAGVTAALGVAVFDGGALRSGEAASRPTTLLGKGLGPVLLAGLAALAEAPGGDLAGLVVGTVALTALSVVAGAGIAAAARGEAVPRLLLRREIPDPRVPALRLSGVVAPRFQRAPGDAERPRAPAGQSHPLPAGTPVQMRLSGHFVDLPRLLETLEWSAFTGYVRVDDGAALGVLVLVAGELSAARLQGDDPATGPDAVRLMARHVSRGEALLDVVELEDETARAVVDLLSAPPLFSGLGARMVNIDGVLEDLGERGRDGAVVVSSPADTGVILVRRGGVHGAYTRGRPRLDDGPAVVTALARDPAALIEVRIAPRRAAEALIDGEAAAEAPASRRPGPLWDRYDEARQAAGLD